VVVEHEVVAGQQAGQFVGRDVAAFLDLDVRVVGASLRSAVGYAVAACAVV